MLQSLRRCLSEWPSLMAAPISSPSAPAPPSSRAPFFHKITGIHVLPGVSLMCALKEPGLSLCCMSPWAGPKQAGEAKLVAVACLLQLVQPNSLIFKFPV